jgi:hypothetical protein
VVSAKSVNTSAYFPTINAAYTILLSLLLTLYPFSSFNDGVFINMVEIELCSREV